MTAPKPSPKSNYIPKARKEKEEIKYVSIDDFHKEIMDLLTHTDRLIIRLQVGSVLKYVEQRNRVLDLLNDLIIQFREGKRSPRQKKKKDIPVECEVQTTSSS